MNIQQMFGNVKKNFINKTEFSIYFLGYKNTRWVSRLIKEGKILTVKVPYQNTNNIIPTSELYRFTKELLLQGNLPKKIYQEIREQISHE